MKIGNRFEAQGVHIIHHHPCLSPSTELGNAAYLSSMRLIILIIDG